MRSLELAWRASPLFAVASIVLAVTSGLLPIAFTIATGRVVGALPDAIGAGAGSPASDRFFRELAILVAVYVARSLLIGFEGAVTTSLGSRFTLELRREVLAATLGPAGIAHLEDPELADELRLIGSQDARYHAENLVHNIASVASEKITGLGSAILLASFRWWAPLVICAAVGLAYRWILREIDEFVVTQRSETAELRRSDYFRDLAVRPHAAKEIRIFGLATWLVSSFASTWLSAMRPQWRQRKAHTRPLAHAAIGQLLAGLAVFGVLARSAFTGDITLGAFVVFAGAVLGMRNLGPDADSEWAVLRGFRVVNELVRLRALTGTPGADLAGAARVERAGSIAFEDVRFAYPGTDAPVLDGFSLEIPQGRSLAIVGLNGAGKTTLMKLLARLYDPDVGRITASGIDIRDVAPDDWRRRIGVIFQDFVRYELDARANVGFGAVELLHRDDVLERAARSAGASGILDGFAKRWVTVLSRGYEGGVDLSGGEWQRIALARALMALEGGADILVLDEPTANLDVRAEAELFDRFIEITSGVTTILISHRFSTVRHADRIAVLEGGRVIEFGTHDELIAEAGRYTHLFSLQAERFATAGGGTSDA